MVTDDDGYPSGSGVRMVWTGEEYGLIWKEARGDFYGSYHTDVLFARVDADGNRIGSVKQVFTSLRPLSHSHFISSILFMFLHFSS